MLKRASVAAIAAMIAVPSTGHAVAFWNQLCTNGGWTFNSCASAWVDVGGANNNTITLRIWNLAGLPGSNTFADAGFTGIGLGNIGSGLVFQNLVAKRVAGGNYAGWSFNNGSSIPGPSTTNGVVITGIGDAIFSQWATNIAGGGSPEVTNWAGSGQFGSGYVEFQFDAFNEICTGTGQNRVCNLMPATINLSNAVLGLHIQAGPNGDSTGWECVATGSTATNPYPCSPPPSIVVPEPATMMLLATGLVGLGAVQLRRRRRTNK